MTETASAQLRRVLALIPQLADDEAHPLDDVAAAAGVHPDMILADLAAISDRFDVPGGFVEGISILVESGTVSVLTMAELCALELGLTMLRSERTPAEQGPIERSLARLRDAISRVPTNDRHEGVRYGELAGAGAVAHLTTVRAAIVDSRKLSLRYRAGGARESTERVISPHSLQFAEQMWYVVATGEDDALRFFRLDRVEGVRVLDERFERDAGVAHQMAAGGRAFVAEHATPMTVRYSPRIARWVAEREGHALDPDGGLTVDHPVADESWAIRHLLQYGPDAEVLRPPALRARLVECLAFLASPTA
jgi:predicted DNA-binding transcriptional regulator YafY